jgi:uncharacterized protein DUF6794
MTKCVNRESIRIAEELIKLAKELMKEDMIKPISHYPNTVQEAVDRLLAELPIDQQNEIASMSEDDLHLLHFGLGIKIRNEFGFFDGNDELMEDCGEMHEDECSEVIIKALWERLKDKQ